MTEVVTNLKALLEGKRVLSVKESSQRESICEIEVEEGKVKSSFTLYATDLGAWVGNSLTNGMFMDVKDMFEEIFQHHTKNHDIKKDDIFESCDDPMKRTFGFRCKKCDKKFITSLTVVKGSEYAEFFTTPDDRRKLAEILGESYILDVKSLRECLSDKT